MKDQGGLLEGGSICSRHLKMGRVGTSLVAQWLRVYLAIQRTWVRSLVRQLRSHMLWSYYFQGLQLLSLCATAIDPKCYNRRSLIMQGRSCLLQLRPHDKAKKKKKKKDWVEFLNAEIDLNIGLL